MKKESVLAPIKERYTLSAPGATKETFHVVIDLKGLGLKYQVGDCLAITPQNKEDHVQRALKALGATGKETVVDTRAKESLSLVTFLQERADLFRVKKALYTLLNLPPQPVQTQDLLSLLEQNAPLKVELQAFCNLLFPLLPRFYSIASCMDEVGDEAHLTVGLAGLCTEFLCKRAPTGKKVISLYHHPSKGFTLKEPSFSKPIIMIGPGTGIAPFIGFLQERVRRGAKENWLFFGERHQATDFYYKDYLTSLQNQGALRLTTAFSRDQEYKVYVQDRMLEQQDLLWEWLERGAYLFVCGDASKMAKAVEQTLQKIVSDKGQLDVQETKNYVRNLRLSGRYLKDVY